MDLLCIFFPPPNSTYHIVSLGRIARARRLTGQAPHQHSQISFRLNLLTLAPSRVSMRFCFILLWLLLTWSYQHLHFRIRHRLWHSDHSLVSCICLSTRISIYLLLLFFIQCCQWSKSEFIEPHPGYSQNFWSFPSYQTNDNAGIGICIFPRRQSWPSERPSGFLHIQIRHWANQFRCEACLWSKRLGTFSGSFPRYCRLKASKFHLMPGNGY